MKLALNLLHISDDSTTTKPFIFFLQVLDNAIEAEQIIQRYEALASDLLEWIEKTISIISNQKFANSLTGVQQQLQAFTTYCTIEKPIKYAKHHIKY